MNVTTTARPWGSFTRFTNNEPSTVKLLYIKKGEEFSLQYHTHREEFWQIVSGSPEVIVGEKNFHSKVGEQFTITPHTPHRVSAPIDDVVILEISTGLFDENDIIRLEDKYGR